jgi:hypothetical protein
MRLPARNNLSTMPNRVLILCVLTAALAGCASSRAPTWSSIEEGARTVQLGRYSVELPGGWMQLKSDQSDRFLVSRDGSNLQLIEFARRKPEEAFPNLKRGVPAGAAPAELAELQAANLRASQGWGDLKVAKNEPIAIAGTTGYSVLMQAKSPRGLRYERIVVGFAEAGGYYTLSYQGTTLHYFGRDRAAFDALLRSLRAVSGSKPG